MEEITWQAFEYDYKPKSANWFWVVWILAFGIFWTAYTFSNILFGILVLVGTFSISLFASRKPDLINIILNNQEIIIHNKRYDLKNLESFWIEDNPNLVQGQRKILLKSKRKTSPYIIVPLNSNVDTEEIKEYLLQYLEETEHQESFFQILLDKIWS